MGIFGDVADKWFGIEGAGDPMKAPEPSAEEQELMNALKYLALQQPALFNQLRGLYMQTSPQFRQMDELLSMEIERYKGALRGDFKDPYMERELARQRRIGTEEISRQFGARRPLLTTGGQRAYADIGERELMGRFAAQQSALAGGAGRTMDLARFKQMRRQANLAGLQSLYQPGTITSALQPYFGYNMMEYDTYMQNWLRSQEQAKSLYGLLGTAGGAIAGSFAGPGGTMMGAQLGGALGGSLSGVLM